MKKKHPRHDADERTEIHVDCSLNSNSNTMIPGTIPHKSLDRSNIRTKTSASMPLWSKSLETTDDNLAVPGDILTLNKDMNRVANCFWNQRTNVQNLNKKVHTLQKKICNLEKDNEKVTTKLRRVTLAMPTEQRRRILVYGPKKEKEKEKQRKLLMLKERKNNFGIPACVPKMNSFVKGFLSSQKFNGVGQQQRPSSPQIGSPWSVLSPL